jgi:phospholipase/carboxylesterase
MNLLHTLHVPPGDGPFPTVIALHGWGAGAHDLLGLAPFLAGERVLTLCPQGRTRLSIGPGAEGYGWFPLERGRPPEARAFHKASRELRAFVDAACERYPIDRRRTVALGFSQGGLMAIDLALRAADRFAGLVVLSSWMPEILAANLPETAAQKGFPVLLVHGTEDPQVEIARARESRPIFERFGVDLTYHEFAMGHEIRSDALTAIVRWLQEKVLDRP